MVGAGPVEEADGGFGAVIAAEWGNS